MTTEKTERTRTPIFLAEAAVGITAGAFTTRVILGTGTQTSDASQGALELIMPTAAMYQMALSILQTIGGEGSAARLREIFSAFTSSVEKGIPLQMEPDQQTSTENAEKASSSN